LVRFEKGVGCRYQYRDQRERPDLTNPETLQLFQDTRFEQLRVRHFGSIPGSACMATECTPARPRRFT